MFGGVVLFFLSEIQSVFAVSEKESMEHPTSNSRERARDYAVRLLSVPCAGLSTTCCTDRLCFVPPISCPQVQKYTAQSVVPSHISKHEPELFSFAFPRSQLFKSKRMYLRRNIKYKVQHLYWENHFLCVCLINWYHMT